MTADRIIRQIKARLSLRPPQADSLDMLADVLDRMAFEKGADLGANMEAIAGAYPQVTDFEREFPSLCFALATGVGKTRLMGAFVTYLYQTGRSRHFFVLAPNTTIYDKLVADFTQNTEKYVFKGIAEFVQMPPIIVTGDTWDQGRGVRGGDLLGETAIVNIFNVDKINKDAGRIKKLHEYIGQSYFDYLAELPDLVLLMDEAHRYRAKAGMKAVAELKPVLGLELTATPRSVGAKSVPFKNVVFDYGLGQAMADGFVKEPAVATRKDFRPESVTAEQLERIKLEDGIHCHENTKAELDIYSRQSGRPLVHPFMLVVAQDTTHAEALRQIIEAEDFFGGRYKGRVIRVDSAVRGEESDEAMARLIGLETDAATDVVIHVNKLKEGWDVRNLYTIVPLRASASDILTEQTLGRGLRLPYGVRTGVDAVDTLTVIAHDRFDDVIRAARDPNSIIAIRKGVIVGQNGDVSADGATVLESRSLVEGSLIGHSAGLGEAAQAPFVFETAGERIAADYALRLIQDRYERELKKGIQQLSEPGVRARITADVEAVMAPAQAALDLGEARVNVAKVVDVVAAKVAELTIEIPEIVVLPTHDVTFGFRDFDLSGLEAIARQPIADEIMVQKLRDETRTYLARSMEGAREERPENYIVRHLMDMPEVDYDSQSALLFKLSGQMVSRLRAYLSAEEDVENVLLVHGKDLARFIFEQMKHGGFRKCCYPYQRFQSAEEREFAVLIDSDNEPSVIRWMKPGAKQFQIEYTSGQAYEPDFVVETKSEKLIVEIKAANEVSDPIVQAKARAAEKWIGYANAHAAETHGKEWRYALVPHDMVGPSATLAGLIARYQTHSQRAVTAV